MLERDLVIEETDRRLEEAADGHGGLLAVTGPAGIGRTRLARVVADRAAERGFIVRSAQGHQLEEEVPYGVLRQLIDPLMQNDGSSYAEQMFEAVCPDDDCWDGRGAAFHKLYLSVVGLAANSPLVLIVDDAHWADPQSLRWLHYLARRSTRLRVLTIVLSRTDEQTKSYPMVTALRALAADRAVNLKPLSPTAVAALVTDALGDTDRQLVARCLHNTGGNPFLLTELIGQIREWGQTAADHNQHPEHYELSRSHAVETLVSPAVRDAVLARLSRLGPDALAVARAAVVLGESGRVHQVAALAGVDRSTAAAQCDLLRHSGVLAPAERLRFVHPLVAAALRMDIPTGRRSLMHTQAARLIAQAGAPAASIAGQLLQSSPAGDAWVVRWLRRAARQASAAGTPEIAVHYLERAVCEPPVPRLRGRVHLEWGAAAAQIDPRTAVPQFRLAWRLAATDRTRCAAALGLARALAHCDRMREADDVLADAAAGARNPSARLRLWADRLMWNGWWGGCLEPATRSARLSALTDVVEPPGGRPMRQMALILRAWELTTAAAPGAHVAKIAQEALHETTSWGKDGEGVEFQCLLAYTLICGGRPEQALALLDAGIAELDKKGRRGADQLLTLSLRAMAAYRLGQLVAAENDARAAWLAAAEQGPDLAAWWWSSSVLTTVLTARGDLTSAHGLATRAGLGERSRESLVLAEPSAVRGELRLAQGRFTEAAADLRTAGLRREARGCVSPSCGPWQMNLALALRADAPDEARAVANKALRLAGTGGAAWALGRALRTVGLVTPGAEGLDALEESVRVLADSSARYEHAASLICWGAALRRANRREAAREPLSAGLELADCCGAAGLVERARREMAATGARPRRSRLTGPGALTPSEARVAGLAAHGLGNVQIARTLQITRKTVEKHLANAYLKLDIHSRRDLKGALPTGISDLRI